MNEATHVEGERLPRDLIGASASRPRRAVAFVAGRLRSAWSHRSVRVGGPLLALALVLPAAVLVHYVYLDRSGLPDLEPFIRFEPPTIGKIYNVQGEVLIELAREHRRVVSYDEMPLILRQAILAAEDKNFFFHSGVEYRALPRVVLKTAVHSLAAWREDGAPFHVIGRVMDASGAVLYEAPRPAPESHSAELSLIQEGLRGVVRLPNGTAHSLDHRNFPIPVMGKTGTTSDFRDALFVGSTYGPKGITVAVRIGFDDNRPLGERETRGRTALPIFREVMLRVYKDHLAWRVPKFPRKIEERIDAYLATQVALKARDAEPQPSTEIGLIAPARAWHPR